MADASLQDRLRGHSKAFDGLLSLIPAKMYYGEEQEEEQWNKKKQSKASAKAARKGRLDPDSELNRNAKEVMDERAKNKRKRRQMEQEEAEAEEENEDDDNDDYEAVPGVEAEKPGEGLKKKKAEQPSESNKKQKIEDNESNAEEEDDEDEDEAEEQGPTEAKASSTPASSSKSGKMTKKQQKMAAKKEKARVKKTAKKAKKEELRQAAAVSGSADAVSTSEAPKSTERRKHATLEEPESDSEDEGGRQDRQAEDQQTGQVEAEDEGEGQDQEGAEEGRKGAKGRQALAFDGSLLQQDADDASARSHPDSGPHSPIFDTNNHDAATASTSTSVSSTVPPSEKPKHIKLPADMDAVRARLAAKIEALRAARKADGPDGKPIRTRQELIESRRAKQAQRKAHRQEVRRQARLEEQEKRERALASNSPSIMSPALELDGAGGYSFGRVAFGDGTRLSHDLTYVLSGGKRRGPSDPKTALLKVQNQKARLQELDDEKREDIAEKEQWLTARRRAEGEKIRNDEDLLKKAVKRKETTKKKSEQAWKDRSKGVINAQKERQKKREENIKKRREDKMLGKAGKKKKAGGAKKARPGFEGSLGVGGRRK